MARPHARRSAGPPRRHRFGQHFLAPAWAERVLAAIDPEPGDVFLEVGPGRGALTLPLARTGVPILAVEIDRDLTAALSPRVPGNVTLLTGDILSLDVIPYLGGLQPQRPPDSTHNAPIRRVRMVGNLPYNISSPILFWLIERSVKDAAFTDATVMLQREVADRIVARPGTKDYGVLTVLPPAAFTPPPKVRSSVVRLTFHPPSPRVPDEARFATMVKALFSQRRKMLSNALKRFDPNGPAVLATARIDGHRRPETLQLEELTRLAELLAGTPETPML
jgi:16S rRNA (adenine1518-N6/adenine1519-N6)-dimethyltransferase